MDEPLQFVRRVPVVIALALTGVVGAVSAQPESSHARPTFVQRTAEASAGSTALVGIDFRIDREWHIYWDGSNDSGMAPVIEFDLPAGFEAGEIRWPAPTRYVSPGGILDHIYEDRVTLLVPISIPEDASGGATLRARLRWLECRDICLMGSSSIETTLRVGTDETKTSEAPLFDKALARMPRALPDEIVAVVDEGALRVRAPGATRTAFYAGPDCEFLTDLLSDGVSEGETLTVRIDSTSPTPRVEGVLEVTDEEGKTSWYRVDLHPPTSKETEDQEPPEATSVQPGEALP